MVICKRSNVDNRGSQTNRREDPAETAKVLRTDRLGDDHPARAGGLLVPGIEQLAQGTALLVMVRGPNAGARFLLDRPCTTAGRDVDSDVFLDDITVSRHHAEFRHEGEDFVVVDQGSLNGIYVNRQPVTSSVLAHGDEVHIGKFRLLFVAGPQGRVDKPSPGTPRL